MQAQAQQPGVRPSAPRHFVLPLIVAVIVVAAAVCYFTFYQNSGKQASYGTTSTQQTTQPTSTAAVQNTIQPTTTASSSGSTNGSLHAPSFPS